MVEVTMSKDEIITIGKDGGIKIMVTDVRQSYVMLGVEAPSGTKIYRNELYKRIQNNIECYESEACFCCDEEDMTNSHGMNSLKSEGQSDE